MSFLDKLANFIVKSRWWLCGIFVALALVSIFVLMPKVGTNYDMTKYLPENSQTKIALNVMNDEYGSIGNASLMVKDVSVQQANSLVTEIKAVNNVATVVFNADDTAYYKDGNALIKIFFTAGDYAQETEQAINDIRTICDAHEIAMAGGAVDGTSNRDSLGNDVTIILIIAVIIVLGILTLTSRSWLEPLVYLCVIGIAIIINMGTNLLLGEISFITQSISTIMLIALEMDYCIVLCSRFKEEEAKGKKPLDAMKSAIRGSFTAILASSCTVIAGLVALMFMQYSIGFDIGAVLAKGVFISILAVLFFMPSVILAFSKLLKKTQHKSFLPKMDKIGSFANKAKRVIPIAFLIIIVSCAALQGFLTFSYSATSKKVGTERYVEETMIEETFGKQTMFVVMMPKDNIEKQIELYNAIGKIDVTTTPTITSKTAIVDTPLYTPLTKNDIVLNYGLPIEKVNAIFTALNQTDFVYTIDLLTYLHEHPEVISSVATEQQTNINNLYQAFISFDFYTPLNVSQAQAIYNLEDPPGTATPGTTMTQVFANALNRTFESIDNVVVAPHYKIMAELLANANTYNLDPSIKVQLTAFATSEYHPFSMLSKQDVQTTFKLSTEIVDQIFSAKNLDQNIMFAELIQTLSIPNPQGYYTFSIVAEQTQQTIDQSYAMAQEVVEDFNSEHYTRMIFTLNVNPESPASKVFNNCCNNILANTIYTQQTQDGQTITVNYDEVTYIVSEIANVEETGDIFRADRLQTDLIIVFAILLIVVIAFRGAILPILLVLTIQGAIWVNMACNVIINDPVFFICYLLGMAIQMGATIDYGILLSDRYMFFRQKTGKVDAMKQALNSSLPTILTSGLILIIAPFIVYFVSSLSVVSEIGLLVGRGALISVIAILFVLPSLLLLFDKLIEKTTYKKTFFKEPKYEEVEPVESKNEKITSASTKKNTTKKTKKTSKK